LKLKIKGVKPYLSGNQQLKKLKYILNPYTKGFLSSVSVCDYT
jgi:hypothetical protein